MTPSFKFALREGLGSAFVPALGSSHATGWDVRAAWTDEQLKEGKNILQPGDYVKIPLGFRVLSPIGWWLELRPRSSTFGKKHLHALYGVIDEDYEGECLFACHLPKSEQPLEIFFGEAIGQIIPVEKVPMIVSSVSNEEFDRLVAARGYHRGAGGFGSTDKK